MQLSEHFTLAELILSQTASRLDIPNEPPAEIVERLKSTCEQMEAVRSLIGHAVIVSSGYRSERLNAMDGGVKTSAHVLGYAIDFICPAFGSPLDVARLIASSPIKFDQLIREYGWVHISFDPRMRRQVLTKASKTSPYVEGLTA